MKFLLLSLALLLSSISLANAATEYARVYDIGTYVTDLPKTEEFYTSVFGLKVLRRWDTMEISLDGKNYTKVALKGLYLQGAKGMHLEFLQKAEITQRQESQQPINHFAMEVQDVAATVELALSKGATEAFPGTPLQYIKLGGFSVLNTQIIGLDGERIQVIQILSDDKSKVD